MKIIQRTVPALLLVSLACAAPDPAPNVTAAPPTSTSSVAPEPGQVRIELFLFNPDDIEIRVGDTVTWTNIDQINHTVTDGVPSDLGSDGQLKNEAGQLFDHEFSTKGGDDYEFTFEEPGKVAYFCSRHPHMVGTVTVTS